MWLVNSTEPLYIVVIQLKTLMADGTATRKLRIENTMLEYIGLAGREHVVAPHDEPEDRDGDRRERDELIAENTLLAVGGDDLVDDPQARKHHDVDRRMAV